MSGWKKLAQAAAASADGLDIDDVFQIHTYYGNGSSRSINNGIDISTEGGMLWLKDRFNGAYDHQIYDTERGASKKLAVLQYQETTETTQVTSFNTNGFSLGSESSVNKSGDYYSSWCFRKAPRFFDVVTWTGDGTTNHSKVITHNLGSSVGFIAVKGTTTTFDWQCAHRSLAVGQTLKLNATNAASGGDAVRIVNDTSFSVAYNAANQSGQTYVAYLFAHNDGDGTFGPTGDQDIIKCGSYTGSTSSPFPKITLGFEPQFLVLKSLSSGNWHVIDSARGICSGERYQRMKWNASEAEENGGAMIHFNPDGFEFTDWSQDINAGGTNYIYMAIRKGPLNPPESASDVFDVAAGSYGNPDVNGYVSGFKVDMAFERDANGSDSWDLGTRLTDRRALATHEAWAETDDGNMRFDYPDKFYGTGRDSDNYGWMWRAAPTYFDVVTYLGTSNALNVPHNLGVVPEMMWVKNRTDNADWIVYHKDLGNATYSAEESFLKLNANSLQDFDTEHYWNGTAPTATQFTVSGANNVNGYNDRHVAMLFATLDGVSKVGSYTGDGTTNGSKVIDCGFTNGPALVLIKIASGEDANNWFIFDTTRGLVAGSEPRLLLNLSLTSGAPEDYVDPHNSGFIVGCASNTRNSTNVSGSKYIFYAIAA